MENLERVKNISKDWDEKYRRRQQEDLKKIEVQIKVLFENNREGVFSRKELEELKDLEARKDGLLLQEEKKWRLKSRALVEGDQKTNFLHKYASHRKSINTNHEVRYSQGTWDKTFEEKTKADVEHFQELFKNLQGAQ